MKTISIIIPTYNRPQMLRRALMSIKTDEKEKVEIIVCDDISTEENQEKNKKTCEYVSSSLGINITYLKNSRTKGVSGARNCAIEHSVGEWLLFLDDDDEFTENYINVVIKYLSVNKGIDLLWSNVFISKKINDIDVRVKKYFTPKTKDELYKDFISIGLGYGVVIKKNAIIECGLFDESLKVAEDTDLFLKLIKNEKQIVNLSDFGVILYEHQMEKLSSNYLYHAKNHIFRNLYRKYFTVLRKYDFMYVSLSSWIINVYKQAGMKKEAYLFCFEFWMKKFYLIWVIKQFIYEIKNLRWR